MREKWHSWFFSIILSLLLPFALAQEESPEPLTLSQAIEEAWKHSPVLSALQHKTQAQTSEASAVARTRWGTLSAVGSYSHLNDSQILRPMAREIIQKGGFQGMPFDRNQVHYGVTYQIPLYLGGKLHQQIQIAKLEKEKVAALWQGTKWQVRFNVVSLYTAIQTLDAVEKALDEQFAALEQTKTNLDAMVHLGKRPEVDRLKVIDEIERVQAAKAEVEAERRHTTALLLAVMGREKFHPIQVDPIRDAPLQKKVSATKLFALLDQNSQLRQAELQAEQAARKVKVAASTFLPKVYAQAEAYEHSGLNSDRSLGTWAVGVGVSIPLFQGTSRFQQLHAAKEMREAAIFETQKVRLNLQAEMEGALAALEAADRKVHAAYARIAAAQEAARIERVRYKTGAGTIEDLLRAEARVEDAKAALAAALAERVRAKERINTLVEQEVLQ